MGILSSSTTLGGCFLLVLEVVLVEGFITIIARGISSSSVDGWWWRVVVVAVAAAARRRLWDEAHFRKEGVDVVVVGTTTRGRRGVEVEVDGMIPHNLSKVSWRALRLVGGSYGSWQWVQQSRVELREEECMCLVFVRNKWPKKGFLFNAWAEADMVWQNTIMIALTLFIWSWSRSRWLKKEKGGMMNAHIQQRERREKPWIILTYGKCVAQVQIFIVSIGAYVYGWIKKS